MSQPVPPRPPTVTIALAVGLAAIAAATVTVWAAFSGLVHGAVAAAVAVVLVVIADKAWRAPRGVPPLYHFAPSAPAEARARGTLLTAVVEHRQTTRARGGTVHVTWQLLVAGPSGKRYRTTTMATLPKDRVPAHGAGSVAAVRALPEQDGVVVIVDDAPPGLPPGRPSRSVPTYSGAPVPTRGTTSQLLGGLLMVGSLLLGALGPIVVVALL